MKQGNDGKCFFTTQWKTVMWKWMTFYFKRELFPLTRARVAVSATFAMVGGGGQNDPPFNPPPPGGGGRIRPPSVFLE